MQHISKLYKGKLYISNTNCIQQNLLENMLILLLISLEQK